MNIGAGYRLGGFYGGTIHSPELTLDYSPNKFLQFNVSTEYSNIQIPEFETFDFTINRLTIAYTPNVKWTISSFAQHNSADNLWAMNSRIRYNPKDGVNLFVVYNGFYNSNRTRIIPRLPTTETSLLVIKYSHTFIW